MTAIQNSLPIAVVSAVVAHFDRDLDTLHFSHSEVHIHINSWRFIADSNRWLIDATHISGQDIRIIVRNNQIFTMSIFEDGSWLVFTPSLGGPRDLLRGQIGQF
jgi:hypothetical protein